MSPNAFMDSKVVVIGGGPIGLAIAWRLQQTGFEVMLIDTPHAGKAWSAAAGMLAPVSEAEFGEDRRLPFALRSAQLFPDFCDELFNVTGIDPGYRDCGTLFVARDQDDTEELHRLYDYRHSLGLDVESLRPSEARRIEPGLAPSMQFGLHIPSDNAIDPNKLITALKAAVEVEGVSLWGRAEYQATEIISDGANLKGVLLKNGHLIECSKAVIAAGAWSDHIPGSPIFNSGVLRPVKGQSFSLKVPHGGDDVCDHVVRTTSAYLVPRGNGEYLLGGTMEEQGWNIDPTVGAAFELIRDMSEVLPGILELDIDRINVGFRPGSRDNLPLIGESQINGLTIATGHFRNGILLTPATAELVEAIASGAEIPQWAKLFSPMRFSDTSSTEDQHQFVPKDSKAQLARMVSEANMKVGQ